MTFFWSCWSKESPSAGIFLKFLEVPSKKAGQGTPNVTNSVKLSSHSPICHLLKFFAYVLQVAQNSFQILDDDIDNYLHLGFVDFRLAPSWQQLLTSALWCCQQLPWWGATLWAADCRTVKLHLLLPLAALTHSPSSCRWVESRARPCKGLSHTSSGGFHRPPWHMGQRDKFLSACTFHCSLLWILSHQIRIIPPSSTTRTWINLERTTIGLGFGIRASKLTLNSYSEQNSVQKPAVILPVSCKLNSL